jgi:hypothetical protein
MMIFDLRENIVEQTSYKAIGQNLEHYYAILVHLSTYFTDSVIVDLGTNRGGSAAALSYNKSNEVYTFDIAINDEAISLFEQYENITYLIGNCIENNWNGQPQINPPGLRIRPLKSEREIFLSSELIFLDIDPHDGIQEAAVLDFLVENDYKGIMVCDDIGHQHPPMHDWWDSIELNTYTIANKYASGTGTGIICFDNQEVLSDVRIP